MAKAASSKKSSSRAQAPASRLSLSRFLIGAAIGGALAVLALKVNFTTGLVVLAAMVMATGLAIFAYSKKRKRRLSSGPILGAVVFGVAALTGVQMLGTSLADDCRPAPRIKKGVQNMTSGGPLSDANSAGSAVRAKPGDILHYVIVVSNVAPDARERRNDVAYANIVDQLPEGVELVNNPGARTFTDRITDVVPGIGVVKTYQAKVTSTVDGAVQQNAVCLSSDSIHRSRPSRICDVAFTRVNVPPPPVTPAPPAPTPPPPPAPVPEKVIELPAQLPQTGTGNYVVIGLMALVTGYIFSLVYTQMKNRKRSPLA